MGLAAGVLDHQLGGVAALELLDPRDLDVELDPELGQDLPSLGRPRR
jgi:hypothetical protein